MRATDTKVLIRLVTGDDPQQTRSAEEFIARGAWVSVVVLADTMWVLKDIYGFGPADIATAVASLLENEHIILQDADAVAAALDLLRSRPALGFADCLILELARKAGHLPLATFDRKLGKVDGAELLR